MDDWMVTEYQEQEPEPREGYCLTFLLDLWSRNWNSSEGGVDVRAGGDK